VSAAGREHSSGETRFTTTWYDSPRAGRLAIVTIDNGLDHRKPTTFDAAALRSLADALDVLETAADGDQPLRGLLLTGKPFVFSVGADLSSFTGADAAFARRAARQGHAVFRRVAALPFPTLAAINGVCLGGGLELALHCDYRTISTAVGAVAFPEVFLSIVPGWGGTQRAPRLVGGAKALQVIVHNPLDNNRMLDARHAFELGLADRLVPGVDFLDASVALLERLVTGEERITRRPASTDGLERALADARRAADDRVHGATPAPYLAIDLIEHAARGGDLDEGYHREAEALATLLPARQAQAAVYAFDLTQRRVKRQPWRPAVPARDVRKVAVVGAGVMGAQLGSLLLQRLEVPLVMKDIDQGALEHARAHIEGELDRRVVRGGMAAGRAAFAKSLVRYTTDYQPLVGADFVLEAVLERLEVKQRVFADVESVVDPACVLATNTSSLSVTQMAAGLAHPERVVGFHFFNPVAVLPLLELVKAQATDEATLSTAFEVAGRLRRSAVLCADTPAFIVNRLLTRLGVAGVEALRSGSSFTAVDDAVKELGLPMGPFELMGFVGIKVAFSTARTLHDAYPDRFPLDPFLAAIAGLEVDGIYDTSRGRVPHDAVAAAVRVDPHAQVLSAEDIRRRALEAVAEEAKIMLDEGVVADARDIDTSLLLGAGWPFFMGGVCMYLDQIGMSQELFGHPLVDPSLLAPAGAQR